MKLFLLVLCLSAAVGFAEPEAPKGTPFRSNQEVPGLGIQGTAQLKAQANEKLPFGQTEHLEAHQIPPLDATGERGLHKHQEGEGAELPPHNTGLKAHQTGFFDAPGRVRKHEGEVPVPPEGTSLKANQQIQFPTGEGLMKRHQLPPGLTEQGRLKKNQAGGEAPVPPEGTSLKAHQEIKFPTGEGLMKEHQLPTAQLGGGGLRNHEGEVLPPAHNTGLKAHQTGFLDAPGRVRKHEGEVPVPPQGTSLRAHQGIQFPTGEGFMKRHQLPPGLTEQGGLKKHQAAGEAPVPPEGTSLKAHQQIQFPTGEGLLKKHQVPTGQLGGGGLKKHDGEALPPAHNTGLKAHQTFAGPPGVRKHEGQALPPRETDLRAHNLPTNLAGGGGFKKHEGEELPPPHNTGLNAHQIPPGVTTDHSGGLKKHQNVPPEPQGTGEKGLLGKHQTGFVAPPKKHQKPPGGGAARGTDWRAHQLPFDGTNQGGFKKHQGEAPVPPEGTAVKAHQTVFAGPPKKHQDMPAKPTDNVRANQQIGTPPQARKHQEGLPQPTQLKKHQEGAPLGLATGLKKHQIPEAEGPKPTDKYLVEAHASTGETAMLQEEEKNALNADAILIKGENAKSSASGKRHMDATYVLLASATTVLLFLAYRVGVKCGKRKNLFPEYRPLLQEDQGVEAVVIMS